MTIKQTRKTQTWTMKWAPTLMSKHLFIYSIYKCICPLNVAIFDRYSWHLVQTFLAEIPWTSLLAKQSDSLHHHLLDWWVGDFSPKDWFLGPQGSIFYKLHLYLYNMVQLVKKKVNPFFYLFCSMYIKKCVPAYYAILAYVDSTFALLDIAVWSKFDQNEMGWQFYSLTSALSYMRSHFKLRLSL